MSLIQTQSTGLTRLLATPSDAQQFPQTGQALTSRPPETSNGVVLVPGVVPLADGGALASNRLFFVPFARGNPGDQFFVRVYRWTPCGDGDRLVWLRVALADFRCTLGMVPGPAWPNDASPRVVTPYDNFCDQIEFFLNGSLGTGSFAGDVVSYGAGSGEIAAFTLDLKGAPVWQAAFEQVGEVSMNGLYGYC